MATRTTRTKASPKSKKLSQQLAVSIMDDEPSTGSALGAKPLLVLAGLLGRLAARDATQAAAAALSSQGQ